MIYILISHVFFYGLGVAMKEEKLRSHIEDAMARLANGATPKRLLEEYTTKLELQDAFFIVTQAQISLREKKYKKDNPV